MSAAHAFAFFLEVRASETDGRNNNTSHASGSSQDGDCATGRLLVFGPCDGESCTSQLDCLAEGLT